MKNLKKKKKKTFRKRVKFEKELIIWEILQEVI